MGAQERMTRYLKYKFTDRELLDLSRTLAESTRSLRETEEAKASIVADFSARIKQLNQSLNSVSTKIHDGYEFRNVECSVEYDWKAGIKTLTRLDTGEEITEPIPPEERQQSLMAV